MWLDDLSRVRLETGSLDKMLREQHVAGVTTNPCIFAKALADAEAYDEQLKDLAAQEVTVEEAVRLLTSYDVRWACDVLRPAYDASNGVDGRVSIEVDPRSAHLTEKTAAEAKTLWWLVDRPNLYIKIPATQAGLPAITATLAEGISVNVTLIFSLERYKAVMDAFLTGLEQAKANGHDLTKIGSVASFFVSRVDSEIDKRLDKIGTRRGQGAQGQGRRRQRAAGVPGVRGGLRLRPLEGAGRAGATRSGRSGPRPGPRTRTQGHHLRRGADRSRNGQHHAGVGHQGVRGPRRDPGRHRHRLVRTAQKVMDDVAAIGVDLEDVFKVLEDEGVQKFEASWSELLEDVKKSLEAAAKGAATRATPPSDHRPARGRAAGRTRRADGCGPTLARNPRDDKKLAGWDTWVIRCAPHRTDGSPGSRSPVLW